MTIPEIKSFIDEINLFISKEEADDLQNNGGVSFPIEESIDDWDSLCYISLWISMRRDLPPSIHNRIMLGPTNKWVKIYIAGLAARKRST